MKMTQLADRQFGIDKSSKLMALKAVKGLLHINSFWNGVDMETFKNASTLEDALRAWGWRTVVDGGGNITDMLFIGTSTQDEKALFRTIAPFVRNGSHIHCLVGEQVITWNFENGRCIRGYENV